MVIPLDKKVREEIDKAIKKVIDKQAYIGGEEVAKLEKEIADYCQVKYAVGVNSGTDALILSLKVLGIGEGDEVITTAFSFLSTATSILSVGAKPVFVDIDPNTYNIDTSKIELSVRTKAILPVHLFGQPADMSPIMSIAKEHDLFVVEDACQAIGAEYKGKRVGSIGDVGCLSFYPTKNLGGFGDGGMVLTNNKFIADKARLLANHGINEDGICEELGMNSRLDAIQATVLRVKLKHLDETIEERLKEVERYNKIFKPPYVLPYVKSVYHKYTIRAKNRKHPIYYERPIYFNTPFDDRFLTETETACEEVMSVPFGLKDKELKCLEQL